jgi:digeranylgeranylglycerophospholipid reductase
MVKGLVLLSSNYDVVVGGGSVGGLSFAAEVAAKGISVAVLEEDQVIGEPEKCDGLVSERAMDKYIAPSKECIQARVNRGTIFSPSGVSASLDARKLAVIVIDRSTYEQQLRDLAVSRGAKVMTASRVTGTETHGARVKVVSSDGAYDCSYYIDATGPSGLLRRNRAGLIPAAKFEVRGSWFTEGEVEVYLDQDKYPGFFAWVIPRGNGIAKVGVAGVGINTFKMLNAFLAGKKSEILTKVAAPIYVGGPVSEFVSGRTMMVGESAGQVKPTTAGGILGSVAAGMISARWVAESIKTKDPALISNYQRDWDRRFGAEFRKMKRLRGIFERLSNEDLENIVEVLNARKVSEKLASTDFDFHATAVLSALGMKGTLQLARMLLSAEAKQALSSLVQ